MYLRFIFILSFLFSVSAFAGKLNDLSCFFIENKGQIVNQDNQSNNNVLYMYSGNRIKIQLRQNGYSYELFSVSNVPVIKPGRKDFSAEALNNVKIITSRVDIDFCDANNNFKIIADDADLPLLNYITCGKEIYNVKSYKKITYKNIYPDTDIEFTITGNESCPLKYNIILRPGADINRVKFLCNGAQSIKREGNVLKIKTVIGEISEKIPFSYYTDQPTQNQPVEFILNNNAIRFSANYDKSKTLIIDPSSNIIWGTYYGGSSLEYCGGTGIDSQNNIYVTGHTLSTSNIATNGVYQNTLNGNFDLFLAKFNTSGMLQWGTYFGGSNYETGYAIYVEQTGNIYVGGNSGSTSNVASPGAHQTVYGGGIDDATLIKFDPNGQRIWSTYYGADLHDITYAITRDSGGNIIICGHTESSNIGNAIATPGAYNTALSFGVDAFVAKFNTNGVRQWGTYFGDSGTEEAWGVVTDAANNIIITGFTTSLSNISTPGGHQPFFGGGIDAFVAKLDPAGANVIWGTYYGGSADEQGAAIEINAAGNIFVGGNTGSSNAIATAGSYQSSPGSSEDIFIACFNSAGVRQWGTYYGGNGTDYIYDLLLDPLQNILFCGQTLSTNSISTASAYQPSIGMVNTYDGYFAKISNAGTVLILGSYYGKSGADAGKGIALDNTGKLYMAGETTSSGGLTTPGIHMTNYAGGGDAFLAKFCLAPDPFITPTGTPVICVNDTYTLNAPNGFASYFWSNGTFANPLVIGPLPPGTYAYNVTVTDAFGCSGSSDSAKVIVDNCITGLKENGSSAELSVFPVPGHDAVFLKGALLNSNEEYVAEVFSSSGQLVLTSQFKWPAYKLDISTLPAGIYFLKCAFSEKYLIRKFIKN